MFTETSDIKENGKVKEFWAFVVFDFADSKVKILELTQNTIKDQIFALARDEDFGDPKTYELKITRTGKDLETKYMCKPLSKSEFTN
jgi:hypothetical protein